MTQYRRSDMLKLESSVRWGFPRNRGTPRPDKVKDRWSITHCGVWLVWLISSTYAKNIKGRVTKSIIWTSAAKKSQDQIYEFSAGFSCSTFWLLNKSPSHSFKIFLSSSPCCCFTEHGTKHSQPKDDGRIGVKRCLIYRDARCSVLCDQDLPGSDRWPKSLPPLGGCSDGRTAESEQRTDRTNRTKSESG